MDVQYQQPPLDRYRQRVGALALRGDGGLIYNEPVEHASIVIEALFSNAQHRVDILSGSLSPRLYGRGSVIQEAYLFLLSDPRNQVRIILEEDSPRIRDLHPFLKQLRDFKNVSLRFADNKVRGLYDYHFIVTDNDNYRFEPDRRKPAAIAGFGNRKTAGNLKSIYSVLWQRCSKFSGLELEEAPL